MKTIEDLALEYVNSTSIIFPEEAVKKAFKKGVEFAQRWISIEDELPKEGEEVLLFNEKWKDEDYNPRGLRIGFLGADGFISAHWWNYQDCYMTISKNECEGNSAYSKEIQEITEPTHWRPIELK